MLQQFLRILDTIQSRTGKAGYLLCNDKIKASYFGIFYHLKEAIPLFCTRPTDSLVDVSWNIGPAYFRLNQVSVILYLILQTVQLFVLICGNPCIKSYA